MNHANTNNRITVKSLLSEAWHTASHVEEGLQRTVIALAVRPGKMMQQYLGGDRKPYQKPFPFLFLTTTIYAVFLHFLHNKVEAIPGTDLPLHERFVITANYLELKYYSWLHLGLLPVYGLISVAIFSGRKYNYAEWLVICCYSVSFILLLLIPYQLANSYFQFSNMANFWIQLLIIIAYTLFTVSTLNEGKKNTLFYIKCIAWAAAIFTTYMYTVQGMAWLIAVNR